MQKLIQQIYSTEEDLECEKCSRSHGHFISLTCDHKYCVLCLSFMYAKHRKLDPNEGTVKCIKCEQITELHPSHLEIVTSTLKQQVFPSIEEDSHAGLSKNGFSIQHSLIGTRKIKSEEHSFENNITPSSSKGFFSKCESPSSFKKQSSKMICTVHRNEPITHICFSCNMSSLCIRCISSTKKHQNHQIKDIKKTLSIMIEQIDQMKIQLNHNTNELSNNIQKLNEKETVIKKKYEKYIEDIIKSFNNLILKIKQKQQEIIEICNQNMQQLLINNNNQMILIQSHLQNMNKIHHKLMFLQKQYQNQNFISICQQIKQQYSKIRPIYLQPQLNNQFKLPSNTIFKHIDQFTNQFCQLNVNFKLSNMQRIRLCDLENCRSQQKFIKQNKRLKTNFVSLNSSRQKNIVKFTKTQQNQTRLTTEKVTIQRQKKSSKAPAYINDYINKKTIKFGSDASSSALQATSPNIQNSKINTKLSKTLCPEELAKKKKDNMLLIKERMERKTTQPLTKKVQLSKKKKIN